ncbi:MAG: hypothetical protein CUN57_00365, partial [Phototrophicales bacterium]
ADGDHIRYDEGRDLFYCVQCDGDPFDNPVETERMRAIRDDEDIDRTQTLIHYDMLKDKRSQ